MNPVLDSVSWVIIVLFITFGVLGHVALVWTAVFKWPLVQSASWVARYFFVMAVLAALFSLPGYAAMIGGHLDLFGGWDVVFLLISWIATPGLVVWFWLLRSSIVKES